MPSLTELKQGLPLTFSIGEPWNFTSQAGDNRLEGKIIHIEPDSDGNPLVLCKVSPFFFEMKGVDWVICSSRYSAIDQDVAKSLLSGDKAVLNCFFFPGKPMPEGNLREMVNSTRSKHFLIGSVKLAD